jgi:hypothetical protein
MRKYRHVAAQYTPMPTERWAVWRKLSRGLKIVVLLPDRPYAQVWAQTIAEEMNTFYGIK